MKDYYKILNVNREDTIQTIKKSYLSLALRHHPDKNNGLDSEFKEILEAYNGIINSYKFPDDGQYQQQDCTPDIGC